MRYGWIALVSVLALTACATPKTSRPKASKAEIATEEAEQRRAVQALNASKFDPNQSYTNPQLVTFSNRLKEVASRVEPAAQTLCREITRNNPCTYAIKFAPREKGINAHADGQNVVVYPALIDFAKNDNHLAFVISHEFAHNILEHVASQKQNVMGGGLLGTLLDVAAATQGVNTQGQFGQIGSNVGMLSYSKGFEDEADYVGLYILARAGYKIEDAPSFWRTMSLADPQGIYGSAVGTHPSNSARYVSMNRAIAEIRAKQQAGQPLIPNFQQD